MIEDLCYTLRWKKRPIFGDYYRNWMKCTIESNIKKGTSVNRFVTNVLDNEIRAYKINNFIKELPTYEILFKRGNNAIITEACIRCYNRTNNHNVPANWDHMWECTSNEYTEEKIMFNALMELENEFKNNTIKIKPLKHVTGKDTVWLPRCSEVIAKELNITAKDKKGKEWKEK
ncbi:hypothetical protein GLOIN_2v1780023 [Rhizophagus irregularis DAOM 181602=DAOM 197198]|nr:hypothetical protein GLOIN_2v1780023 [Rhizophagus irregularis DAOM 181602=DAOM 197198]